MWLLDFMFYLDQVNYANINAMVLRFTKILYFVVVPFLLISFDVCIVFCRYGPEHLQLHLVSYF